MSDRDYLPSADAASIHPLTGAEAATEGLSRAQRAAIAPETRVHDSGAGAHRRPRHPRPSAYWVDRWLPLRWP